MRYPPHPLTSSQAASLLQVASIRDQALIVCLYRAGLRVSEALGLDSDDLRHVSGGLVLRVNRPKGYETGVMPREVGLDPKAQSIIERWLESRGSAPGPLFLTRSGQRIQSSYVRQLLPRLARNAGVNRRVHAHALRHTFARQLYDEGVGLMEIMLALGHSSLATTQKYLRSIGATEVIAATTRREW